MSRYYKYGQRMHFDNIQIINEVTYYSHIFHYTSALFKNISEHKQGYKKIPEHINISTVAMNDKNHIKTDKIKYDLIIIKCIIFL